MGGALGVGMSLAYRQFQLGDPVGGPMDSVTWLAVVAGVGALVLGCSDDLEPGSGGPSKSGAGAGASSGEKPPTEHPDDSEVTSNNGGSGGSSGAGAGGMGGNAGS